MYPHGLANFAPVALRARLAAATLALASCSASGSASPIASFTGTPLETVTSTSGAWSIAVRASPSPPVRGVCSFELAVTDAHDAAVEGLSISVVPWMNAMGHGASVTPTVTAEGSGTYRIDEVTLFMPGAWTLRTTFAPVGGGAIDTANIPVDVQ